MIMDDLKRAVSDLSPNQWRELLLSVADERCIACGSDHACECSELDDAAKERVTRRAAALQSSEGT